MWTELAAHVDNFCSYRFSFYIGSGVVCSFVYYLLLVINHRAAMKMANMDAVFDFVFTNPKKNGVSQSYVYCLACSHHVKFAKFCCMFGLANSAYIQGFLQDFCW